MLVMCMVVSFVVDGSWTAAEHNRTQSRRRDPERRRLFVRYNPSRDTQSTRTVRRPRTFSQRFFNTMPSSVIDYVVIAFDVHCCHMGTYGHFNAQGSASECPDVKITNDGLTLSRTRCFIAVNIWRQWASKG